MKKFYKKTLIILKKKYIISHVRKKKGMIIKMSEKENKEKRKRNKGEIMTKIMAGILAIMMVAGIASTVVFYILG